MANYKKIDNWVVKEGTIGHDIAEKMEKEKREKKQKNNYWGVKQGNWQKVHPLDRV
jgi:hypothetical protein